MSPSLSSRAKAGARSKSPRVGLGGDDTRLDLNGLTRQADLLASRGRYGEALPLVEEALRLEPGRAELHHGRGQCLVHLERPEEALSSFEEALRLNAQCRPALRAKAAALVKQQHWDLAAGCLRDALRLDPSEPELRADLARCLTERGVQLKTAGRPDSQYFHEAVQACVSYAPAYFQLGVENSEAGRDAEAKEMYSKAAGLQPGYVEALNNLGVACRNLSEPDQAVEAYSMALKVNRNCKKTKENMAIALMEVGCKHLGEKEFKKASAVLKQALTYNCQNANIFFNMGVMYAEQQKYDKAKVKYELAVHFEPSHATAWNNLGVIHRRDSNLDAAVHCFEQALKADPKMNLAGKNLGAVYGSQGRMAESIELTRLALEVNDKDAEAFNNLALLYRDQCDVDMCLEHLSMCLRLDPENQHACSNRLMSLNYQSEQLREEVFEAHRTWGEQLERRVPVLRRTARMRSNGAGPLRVGYISPDFYLHSVSYFIHAALKYHDPTNVHVTCYSDVVVEDEKTRIFKSYVPRWRTIHGKADEEVANLIREDGIDILVDITGHTGNNRLGVLARRPAPVIITWMGYPHTTGLTRVDYRISDERADPPAEPGLTTEKLVYLPECFLCYTPAESAPPVSLTPAQETYGCPTFGCFNTLAKVSSLTIRVWSRLLHEVPDARLFLKSKALRCPKVQEKFRRAFSVYGIDASRLDLSGLQPHTCSHLQMYSLVDVALDTAPYAGTTTTCEALFMGVPVVSLRGHGVHAQNVGASLLNAVNLGDLVAEDEETFTQRAAALARDTTRLRALRAGLRTRMLRSTLCDGPRHTARLERIYKSLAETSARDRSPPGAEESLGSPGEEAAEILAPSADDDAAPEVQ